MARVKKLSTLICASLQSDDLANETNVQFIYNTITKSVDKIALFWLSYH